MRRILIAGCGWLGTRLGEELGRAGHRVYGLRRAEPRSPLEGAPPFETLQADLRDPATLRRLPEVDQVVYCASASGGGEEAYRDAYVLGIRHLLGALEAQGAPLERFVFTSSTAVHADEGGTSIDETNEPRPSHFGGKLLLEGERSILSLGDRGLVLRLSGLYGPGREQLLRSVESGEARLPSAPRWTNRIHRDDAASAIASLLGRPPEHPLYLVSDDRPAPLEEVMLWLAERLGVPPPPRSERPPGGRRGRSDKRVSNERLRASGLRLRYPSYREGYGALIEARSPLRG
ncbi:MAG: NAD-dependent epimerase/dehydratase family protein [Myxococcales bacterium]|nr:NAD-dependent epimerase/dehydratase family protein [Myxococcales bacterium]